MAEQAKHESAIRRFSGDGSEPQKDYKLWKRWSRAFLAVQRAKGTDDSVFGAMLFTMLDGTALRAFDAINMDELEQTGGQDLIYQVLDDRFPEEATHDRLGEVLDRVFDLKVDKGESTSGYTGKARAAFSAAEAEGVKLPSVARGYLLLRNAKLPQDKKSVVMAASRQSYEEQDIAAALRTTYPEGLYAGRHSSHVAEVDHQKDEDAGDIGEVLLAEEDEDLLGEDPIEEQDAVDVLLSWKQTRQNINKEKLSRGLSSGGLKKLEARVRCYKCQKVGHFSRNCPNRKGKSTGKGDNSSGSSKVSLVFMTSAMDEEDENKLIDDVMSSWSDRPKDYWTVTDKEVIRHHVNPRSSMFSPARTGCPVPVDQLSTARTTILIDKDGRADEQFTPNWKNSLEAHRKTDKVWTGRTVFYHLEGHGEEDVDPRVNDEKLFEHNDPQDALDRETFGQEYACQVQGLQYEEDDDMRWFNDAALFHFADPEDALDREIFGAEYAFQVEGVEHQVDEITAAFFAEMHEQEQSWPHEDEVDQAFREPGTSDDEGEDESQPQESMCALVHEPGYGILDTGCGRGLVGANTLERHIKMLSKHGMNIKELPDKMHTFRYGNGSADKTSRRIELPVFVAGKELRVRLHVVPGDVPLLISKRLLKSVGAMIDLNDNKLIMTKAGVAAAIHEMKDNSYQINLLDIAGGSKVVSPEVDVLGVTSFQEESSHDEADDDVGVCCVFKAKERKEVLGNVTRVLAQNARDAPSLMEVFSPGRFQEWADQCGITGRGALDLSEGWDWRKMEHRRRAEEALAIIDPDFSVFSPPCGPLSLMQNLTPDVKRVDLPHHQREVRQAKGMVSWSLDRAAECIARGKFFLFESSKTSQAWRLSEMQSFVRRFAPFIIDVPACAVGMRDPKSGLLFGKPWRFMTNCQTVASALGRLTCSKNHDHQAVEGTSGGMQRSIRTQVYPNRLVRIILGAMAQHEFVEHQCYAVSQATVQGDLKGEGRRRVERAIKKLHINLGHASKADMIRILRHHHAQESVLELVKAYECSICQARSAPKAVKESAPPRDMAPLRYVGLDVKHLPSWKAREKIKALNIVCRMSGLQQILPFREQETSEVIGRLYRYWTRSYGRPRYLKFDASRCNLGQQFLDMLERDGTTPLDIPGEAHEQMGDVESQGWHFEEAFRKVVDQMARQDYSQWQECVDVTVEARNSLLRRAGHSPFQLVFGRDPECPGDDLCSEKPNPISNSAILEDAIAEYQHRARSIARQEVLQQLDHKAARIALNSRPRPQREFRVGDEVAIWRRGKGIKKSSARWRGPGIVAGCAGGNYWISMPGSFVECSPEQLRLRTTEEREADRFLVRDLRAAAASLWPEVGVSSRPHQKCYFDITAEDTPPGDLTSIQPPGMPDCRPTQSSPEIAPGQQEVPRTPQSLEVPQTPPSINQSSAQSMSRGEEASPGEEAESIRSSEKSLTERLSQMSQDDRMAWEESARRADRLDGLVRKQHLEAPSEPPDKRQRMVEPQNVGGQRFPPSLPSPSEHPIRPEAIPVPSSSGSSEASSHARLMIDSGQQATSLSVGDDSEDFVLRMDGQCEHVLLAGGRNELNLREERWTSSSGKAKLVAGVRKEIANVVQDKQALRPLTVEHSRRIRQEEPDRIVPSKLVLVEKLDDSGEEIVKARWTARGDKDPDLLALIRQGNTQSPTISSNGRYTVLQVIASQQYEMQLGDVTGAFLEADEMERGNEKLYMAPPKNFALPDHDAEQLFEVIRPIYGLNDSPQKWFMKFDTTIKKLGWTQSKLDHCTYFFWVGTELQGVLGVHVDDVVLGGRGKRFEQSIKRLRDTFPFRKWKIGAGSFCGSELHQCPKTFAISVSQEKFAEKLEKPKLRTKESPLVEINQAEASSLKSVLGGALWLARETRPDLAVQVSQGQQLLPRPTLGAARTVGNVVRRAKQYKTMVWKILPIPLNDLCLCLHTDAAFANAKKQGTQAGYIVGVTTKELQIGKPAAWSPCVWKSYRLKRVVGSTFAGESQVLSDGLGHAEWVACHIAEAKHFDFSLANRESKLREFQLQAIVDCKSIYDHLQNFASPGSVSDKRVAIDLVIVRETLARVGGKIRWAPTWLQLADALTKESPEAMDLLRAAMITHKYHLSNESTMMEAAAAQRQVRLQRQSVTGGDAQVTEQETAVQFVRPSVGAMVKVAVEKISDEEIRALFECMVSSCVVDGDEYAKNMVQSKAMCKARIPARHVNDKLFGGEDNVLTFTFTKTTKMCQVHGSATMLDKAEETLQKVLQTYAQVLNCCAMEKCFRCQTAARSGVVPSVRASPPAQSPISWRAFVRVRSRRNNRSRLNWSRSKPWFRSQKSFRQQ